MVAYNARFELLGYDTTSIVYNLGDMSLIQFWVFVKVLILLFYGLLSKMYCCECMAKKQKHYIGKFKAEKISIFFNWPIRFIFESYLELAVSTLVKFCTWNYSMETGAD